MRISPINNVYQNYNNSFKAKPNFISKVANKALLPTAICAYVLSPLLGAQTKPKAEEYNQIQYEETFVMNDKNYTMTYVNTEKNFGENAVSEIYFVPQDTTEAPLRIEELIRYATDDDYKVSATVSDTKSGEINEIDLPYKIGDKLMDLYEGNSEFFVIPGLNYYREVDLDYFM